MKKLSIFIVITCVLILSFNIPNTFAQEQIESNISAEVFYEDDPNPIKVINVSIRYDLLKGNDLKQVLLPSFLCERDYRNARLFKELPLSDIKEITEINSDQSLTIYLKDSDRIPIDNLNFTKELSGEFFKKQFGEEYSLDMREHSQIIVGHAITDLGEGNFDLDLRKLKSNKVKSIIFSVSDNEKWAKSNKFSLLLSQALHNFMKGDLTEAKSKLTEAIGMCE